MDFNQLFAQAQKMQQDMERQKNQLNQKTYELKCQNDLITGKMNGAYQITELHIQPELLEDVDMLEAMLTLTINQAAKRISQDKSDSLQSMAQGIDLSSLF